MPGQRRGKGGAVFARSEGSAGLPGIAEPPPPRAPLEPISTAPEGLAPGVFAAICALRELLDDDAAFVALFSRPRGE